MIETLRIDQEFVTWLEYDQVIAPVVTRDDLRNYAFEHGGFSKPSSIASRTFNGILRAAHKSQRIDSSKFIHGDSFECGIRTNNFSELLDILEGGEVDYIKSFGSTCLELIRQYNSDLAA